MGSDFALANNGVHACQIGLTDTTPPCPGIATMGLRCDKGEHFGAGNLSAAISPMLLKCADGATTLSLCFGISGSQA